MARGEEDKDFFVYEPCLISDGDSITMVMPTRWFQRSGETYAKAHYLLILEEGYAIDGRPDSCIEVPLSQFLLNVVDLDTATCQETYGLPVTKILGTESTVCGGTRLTNLLRAHGL